MMNVSNKNIQNVIAFVANYANYVIKDYNGTLVEWSEDIDRYYDLNLDEDNNFKFNGTIEENSRINVTFNKDIIDKQVRDIFDEMFSVAIKDGGMIIAPVIMELKGACRALDNETLFTIFSGINMLQDYDPKLSMKD